MVENSDLVHSHIPQIIELLTDDSFIGIHGDADYKPFGIRILTQNDILPEERLLWEPTMNRICAKLNPQQTNKEIK